MRLCCCWRDWGLKAVLGLIARGFEGEALVLGRGYDEEGWGADVVRKVLAAFA